LPAAAAGLLAAAATRDLSADLTDPRFQRLKSQIRQAKIVNPVLEVSPSAVVFLLSLSTQWACRYTRPCTRHRRTRGALLLLLLSSLDRSQFMSSTCYVLATENRTCCVDCAQALLSLLVGVANYVSRMVYDATHGDSGNV
jgi:hypothetical protein